MRVSGDVTTPEFLGLNPNNKIPAIMNPGAPNGEPLPLFESGATFLYQAENAGSLLPAGFAARFETVEWLMFKMGGVDPMSVQMGFFRRLAGAAIEDPRPRDRYVAEVKRLLKVQNQRFDGRSWIMGEDYAITDTATWPWIRVLGSHRAHEVLETDSYPAVGAYLERPLACPASQRELNFPDRNGPHAMGTRERSLR